MKIKFYKFVKKVSLLATRYSLPPKADSPLEENSNKGQSLAEIIIAVSVGVIIIGSAVGALFFSVKSNQLNRANQGASPLAQELLDNVRSVAEGRWQSIYCLDSITCQPAKGPNTTYLIVLYKQLQGTVGYVNGPTFATVTGTGTNFTAIGTDNLVNLAVGDNIIINSLHFTVTGIASDTSLTLNANFPGPDASGFIAYRDFSLRTGVENETTNPGMRVNNIPYTRSFAVEDVRRENCGRGNITTSDETPPPCADLQANIFQDPSTQKITAKVTWPQDSGTSEVSVVEYITRSKNDVSQFSDWSGGPSNPNDVFTQPSNKYDEKINLDTMTPPGELNLP